jgi:hypothetical protein
MTGTQSASALYHAVVQKEGLAQNRKVELLEKVVLRHKPMAHGLPI